MKCYEDLTMVFVIVNQAREKISEQNSQIEQLRQQLDKERSATSAAQAEMTALRNKLDASVREQEELRERLSAAEENAAKAASLSKAEGERSLTKVKCTCFLRYSLVWTWYCLKLSV